MQKNIKNVVSTNFPGLHVRPYLMIFLMIFVDLFFLCLAWSISVEIRIALYQQPRRYIYQIALLYWNLWPGLGLFILLYGFVGLYSVILPHPADELRKLVSSTSVIYLMLAAATFLFKQEHLSRAIFIMSWFLSIIFLPIARPLLRRILAPYPFWGQPVVIMGARKTGRLILSILKKRPELGLKPVVIFDDDPAKWGFIEGIPVIGGFEKIPLLDKRLKKAYAIIAMPGIPRTQLLKIIELYGSYFRHLLLIPDLFDLSSLWVTAKEIGGILGLEVRQELLLPWSQLAKRIMDIVLILITLFPTLIILIIFSILIKLDSPGAVFYHQERMGINGRLFKVIKFRTMYMDSSIRLAKLLEENEAFRIEYETYHKLRNDPRVTRVGQFLRKTSLDELPQIYNVIKGDMSFVGPRAYMPEELGEMQYKDKTILSVLPGITGIWQVSGRNRLSFDERLDIDIYYVRNWSIWLDIYLLVRTFWVVFTGEGAF